MGDVIILRTDTINFKQGWQIYNDLSNNLYIDVFKKNKTSKI